MSDERGNPVLDGTRLGWQERYEKGETPWDTGKPSEELRRVVAEDKIQPGKAIDLGCGTGNNAIFLAQQGFTVTGIDISPLAIERAKERAKKAGVQVKFLSGDLTNPPDLGGPFDFFFDRGCYHAVRRTDGAGYLRLLERITRPGTRGLVLTGNSREPMDPGPPHMSEAEIRKEIGSIFEIVRLREMRFDVVGMEKAPLGWSCLVRRR